MKRVKIIALIAVVFFITSHFINKYYWKHLNESYQLKQCYENYYNSHNPVTGVKKIERVEKLVDYYTEYKSSIHATPRFNFGHKTVIEIVGSPNVYIIDSLIVKESKVYRIMIKSNLKKAYVMADCTH